MPPEIAALLQKPHLLIAVLAVGGILGMIVEQQVAGMRRRAWRARREGRWAGGTVSGSAPWLRRAAPGLAKPADAVDQLRVVMVADFAIQPLLNRSEARVFRELDRVVTGCNPDWRVMAQVSLGEILRSQDADAYRCINAKRVDLLLVDGDCQARHAIEYQGGGHYQRDAAARDAVKKEALRQAGIGYHEVVAGQTTPTELRRLVERIVDRPDRLA